MKIVGTKHATFAVLLLALLASPTHRIHAQSAGGGQSASKQAAAPPAEAAASPEGTSEVEYDENKQYKESASVRKIGSMMGLSPERSATLFEATNFLVLAVLVCLLLAKMLPKAFRDRNTAIQKDLADARTATEDANLRMGDVESRLARLDEEIAALRAQADKASAMEEQRIQDSLAEETKRILAEAEQEIASATAHAQRKLQQYAAELAIEQAARKLVISAETDRLLVQNFARRLGGDDSKEGQN